LAGYFGPGDCAALEKLVPKVPCMGEPEKTKDEKVKDGSIVKTPVGDDKSKGQKEGGESSSSDSSSSEQNEGGESIDKKSSKSNRLSKTSRSANKSETPLYSGGSAEAPA